MIGRLFLALVLQLKLLALLLLSHVLQLADHISALPLGLLLLRTRVRAGVVGHRLGDALLHVVEAVGESFPEAVDAGSLGAGSLVLDLLLRGGGGLVNGADREAEGAADGGDVEDDGCEEGGAAEGDGHEVDGGGEERGADEADGAKDVHHGLEHLALLLGGVLGVDLLGENSVSNNKGVVSWM